MMSTDEWRELSHRCELNAIAAASRSRDVIECGPFQALLDPNTDMIWLNYAVPVGSLDSPADVADALPKLRHIFHERQRVLRFEFNALPWPTLTSTLAAAGLELQARHPVMVCTPAIFRPLVAPGVAVQILDINVSDTELAAFVAIRDESFGTEDTSMTQAIIQLRNDIAAGVYHYALATLDGFPAGIGGIAPIAGVGEVTAIATRPALRRRGVAATVTSELLRHLFGSGGTLAWLSAGDAIAQATYTRVGFATIDERMNYIEESFISDQA